MEIDIVAGDLGVEFNGTFWHSEATDPSRTRCAGKVAAIRNAGLRPLIVWEDDWADMDRRAVLVTMMAHRLGRLDRLADAMTVAGVGDHFDPRFAEHRGARTLDVVRIPAAQADEFFTRTHVQGPVRLSIAYALLDENDEPRAVLGLRSFRHNARAHRASGQWEIQRYATLGIIPGGFTRLLTHAAADLRNQGEDIRQWVTLSANDSSQGDLYAVSGFSIDGAVPPSYWYTGGPLRSRRAAKEGFQRRRFREDPKLVWDESWTEHEAAAANGLFRIYDAGKTRWVKDVVT